MAGGSGGLMMLSGGLELFQGIYGYFAAKNTAAMMESRARMVQLEAEADARRYSEQAASFKAEQSVGYLKSGVTLSGSPLDVLDETARVASENAAAIRAGGRARAFDYESAAAGAKTQGRLSLLSGLTGGIADFSKGQMMLSQNTGANSAPVMNARTAAYSSGGPTSADSVLSGMGF